MVAADRDRSVARSAGARPVRDAGDVLLGWRAGGWGSAMGCRGYCGPVVGVSGVPLEHLTKIADKPKQRG